MAISKHNGHHHACHLLKNKNRWSSNILFQKTRDKLSKEMIEGETVKNRRHIASSISNWIQGFDLDHTRSLENELHVLVTISSHTSICNFTKAYLIFTIIHGDWIHRLISIRCITYMSYIIFRKVQEITLDSNHRKEIKI